MEGAYWVTWSLVFTRSSLLRPVRVSNNPLKRIGMCVWVDAETYRSLNIPESQRYSERMKDKKK